MTDGDTIAWVGGISAVCGGLAGGVFSGVYQHWRDWFYSPHLQIDFGAKRSASLVEVKTGADHGNLDDIYVRVRIGNTGRQMARGCVVYLAALEEVSQTGTIQTVFHDAMPLSWPGWRFEPRDLPTGVDFYIDLMSVSRHFAEWSFKVERLFASQEKLKGYRGTYRFKLVVTANNAKPASTKIDVTYTGDWNSLRAQEVGGRSLSISG